MTKVNVSAGACGFKTTVTAEKTDRRKVSIGLESECEAVMALGEELEKLGPLGIREIMSTDWKTNQVFSVGSKTVSHSACPVLVAVIKAAEVELGLNVPSPVSIEFEANPTE